MFLVICQCSHRNNDKCIFLILQNFVFKIATADFNAPFPTSDPILKCFNKFGGKNASEYQVAGQEDVLICEKHCFSTVPSILETTKNHKRPDPDYRTDVATA